jgi:spore coat protein CotH
VTSRRWDALHEDVAADVQVEAAICIDGREYPIGLELQGASTRDALKKSFDLKFDRGQPLSGIPFRDASSDGRPDGEAYERIIMKAMFEDQSLIREAVAFDLWRELGQEAPRIGFANLRINGDYWGLYVLVEPVNEAYLDRHGYPADGQLYKAVRKHGELADFAPGRDLELAFENKTDEDDPSREDLAALLDRLQDTPLERAAFEREIDPIFPLADYIERMIWVAFTQNGDAVAQNFFLYNAPEGGHDRWYQLPWDSNLCFSAHWRDGDGVLSPESSKLVDGRNHFGRRLVRVDGLREAYVDRFFEVMDHVLTPEVVLHHYRRHADHVAHDLAVDQQRWQRDAEPAAAFSVLTDFFERRPGVLGDALRELIARADQPPPALNDDVTEGEGAEYADD